MTSTLRVRAIQRKREGISAPLVWFPRLFHASTQKRSHWEILGTGQDIHWADVDEDLSVDGLLRGMRAPSPKEAAVAADISLFDDWSDAIEDGVRARVRGFIETMLEEELEVALARPRYGRRKAGGSKEAAAPPRRPSPRPSQARFDRHVRQD